MKDRSVTTDVLADGVVSEGEEVGSNNITVAGGRGVGGSSIRLDTLSLVDLPDPMESRGTPPGPHLVSGETRGSVLDLLRGWSQDVPTSTGRTCSRGRYRQMSHLMSLLNKSVPRSLRRSGPETPRPSRVPFAGRKGKIGPGQGVVEPGAESKVVVKRAVVVAGVARRVAVQPEVAVVAWGVVTRETRTLTGLHVAPE